MFLAGDQLTYTVLNLVPKTTYYFQVRNAALGADGAPTNEVVFTTP